MTRTARRPAARVLPVRIALGVGIVLIAAVVVVVVTCRSSSTPAPSSAIALTGTPREEALHACSLLDEATAAVRSNAAASMVRGKLADAIALAGDAASRDPQYYGLKGSIQQLDIALQDDSAEEARSALGSTDLYCSVLRVPQPGLPN